MKRSTLISMVILLICGKTPALLVTLFLVDSEQQQPPVVANKEEVTVIKTVPFPAAAATGSDSQLLPLVLATWGTPDFQAAAQRSWDSLIANRMTRGNETETKDEEGQQQQSRLGALVAGLSECERRQCDRTVGFGGSPDEHGETTLDALVMDGRTHKSGAVAALRRVKSAVRVAWAVYNYTEHSMLVGEKATQFALEMGFPEETLATSESVQMHKGWLANNCQPNFWKSVYPDPRTTCGPYSPRDESLISSSAPLLHTSPPPPPSHHHDTIGMVLVGVGGSTVVGTSSNGARNKIPGRVGDSPIVGAGAYVEDGIGGAAATGDGDVMLRFLPSFLAVELMRGGATPTAAARHAVARIRTRYPAFFGAVVAANTRGEYGAACAGKMPGGRFPFSVVSPATGGRSLVVHVECD